MSDNTGACVGIAIVAVFLLLLSVVFHVEAWMAISHGYCKVTPPDKLAVWTVCPK